MNRSEKARITGWAASARPPGDPLVSDPLYRLVGPTQMLTLGTSMESTVIARLKICCTPMHQTSEDLIAYPKKSPNN